MFLGLSLIAGVALMLIALRVWVAGASVDDEPPRMCERSGAGVETEEASPAVRRCAGRDAEAVEGAREVRQVETTPGWGRFLGRVQVLLAGRAGVSSGDGVRGAVAGEGFAIA